MRNCGIFAMRLFSANHNASAFHGSARNTSSIPRHDAGLSLSRPIGPISPVSLASAKVLHFRPLTFRFLPFPLKFTEYFRLFLHFSRPPVSPTSQTSALRLLAEVLLHCLTYPKPDLSNARNRLQNMFNNILGVFFAK